MIFLNIRFLLEEEKEINLGNMVRREANYE